MPPLVSNRNITNAIKWAAIIQGKLIFAAAGTAAHDGPVVFPANLSSNLTVAITGVKDIQNGEGETDGCSTCHGGGPVDFVVVTEKGTDTGPITLPMTPDPIYPNRPKFSGGSSAATATAAGIAALVWAAHPNATKNEIYARLILGAELNTYQPSQNHGFGVLHAEHAINAQL